jgi:hypothetical protein
MTSKLPAGIRVNGMTPIETPMAETGTTLANNIHNFYNKASLGKKYGARLIWNDVQYSCGRLCFHQRLRALAADIRIVYMEVGSVVCLNSITHMILRTHISST